MMDIKKYIRLYYLKRQWEKLKPGMTLEDAENIMGFRFSQDMSSRNYINNENYSLPFRLEVEADSGKIIRKEAIRFLDELGLKDLFK